MNKIQEAKIEKAWQNLINILHEELGWFDDEAVKNTAGRVARFYKEWFENNNIKFTNFEVPESASKGMIVLKDIKFYSMCQHHMLLYQGYTHIAYLPREGGKVCGVSKLARVVVKYASRPQIQEVMTNDIADELVKNLNPWFTLVIVKGSHACLSSRGVKQHNAKMITSAVRWDKSEFSREQMFGLKNEALELIRNG